MKTQTDKKTPQEKVVLVLINFEGHESIGDPVSESLRWRSLENILFNQKKYNLVILSDHKRTIHHKMNDYQSLVNEEKRHKWINIDSVEYPNVETIERKLLLKRNTLIKGILMGGTNTSSCVLDSRPWSVVEWIKAGHNVNLVLPMCMDYKKPGASSVEKNINSFTSIWNKIRLLGGMENIKMITDLSDSYRSII